MQEVLTGVVTPYKGNGRRFGYPTANIATTTELTDGVYFGFAHLGEFEHHPALIFIGTPTTVGDTERRVEAHLLDVPDQDYYGQDMTLDVRYFHRPNKKFDSLDDLQVAMHADEAAARLWFKKNK